ncbi:MAG: putative phosphodiesterase [Paenibacillus sp.]|nr:putative phosphodiesterase [Paenibacillus sp.]
MAIRHETELYEPVKRYMEALGFEVRGEVHHCDLVAIRGNEPPIIVELKKTFNIPLLVQGLDRLSQADEVYVAVEMPETGRAPHGLKWSDVSRLCRRLGLGLITVRFYKTRKPAVNVVCEPGSYTPRTSKLKSSRLLHEFKERSGDYNVGGSTKRKLVTAYREKALAMAIRLKQHGSLSPKQLKDLTDNPKAAQLLQKNYYRWFERTGRGIYRLTPLGEQALEQYSHVWQGKISSDQE